MFTGVNWTAIGQLEYNARRCAQPCFDFKLETQYAKAFMMTVSHYTTVVWKFIFLFCCPSTYIYIETENTEILPLFV